MRFWRPALVFALAPLMMLNLATPAPACGLDYIEPIFVFKESPDPPFEEFTRGKIGIVQPTFGRKSLFIAYRYLNGSSFTGDEQKALVEALRGEPPEDDGGQAIKAWIEARKEFAADGETLPEIYTERQYQGYDFFPNCARNAFEVATETLKNRAASYGAKDRNVQAWLAAQDVVFQNCAGGKQIPVPLGPDSPDWLRKDRDYQIAAAFFYSLNFDAARSRFEKIAEDSDSDWRQTADYLVARTLVRQASLIDNETRKRETYEQAEDYLRKLLVRGGQFYNGSQKLLALIKYRAHPEERVRELAQVLAYQSGNQNLRQDLIDYVWLLDKFEGQILKAEEKRKEVLKGERVREDFYSNPQSERYLAVQRGELININFIPKRGDGTPDFSNFYIAFVKYDASEGEILQAVEKKLGRKLNPDEADEVRNVRKSALERREWLLAPNRKWGSGGLTEYEGYFGEEKLTLDLVPTFLVADDLSDWIFTTQSSDPRAYAHALSKWHDTDSSAWLVTALAKAEKASPQLERLVQAAEKTSRNATAFPTITFHLARLKVANGEFAKARKLLDEIISTQLEVLPVSAQNQLLNARAQLAENLSDFLKFAKRKPVTFNSDGTYGRLSELLEIEKSLWSAEYSRQTKEDYELETEERFKDLLPWDTRATFDEQTADILNAHFPLEELATAAHDDALPDYLQRRLTLVVWTRAILLGREEIALKYAEDALKVAPQMSEAYRSFLNARTLEERQAASLWIMLKFPSLTPFVTAGIPKAGENQFDHSVDGWWTEPRANEYNNQGEEVPRAIPRPGFVSPAQSDLARKEKEQIVALGTAEEYLSKRVLEWANGSPRDARIPEALFIVAEINRQSRFGTGSNDLRETAITLLKTRYPNSGWIARLEERDNQPN